MEIRVSSLTPCPVFWTVGRTTAWIVQAGWFSFLVFWFSFFFFFSFLSFSPSVAYPSPPCNSLLDAHVPPVNRTLTFILSLFCFFAKSTSCSQLVRGALVIAGMRWMLGRNRAQESVVSSQQWEKSVDSLVAIRWDGDQILWVLPIHAELY